MVTSSRRRLVLSNPDLLGDLIMREPLYRAMSASDADLMLIVHPDLVALAGQIAPGAQIVGWSDYPFFVTPLTGDASLEPVFAAVRAFAPDMIVAASWQWTMAEEYLARAFAGVPFAGLTGELWRYLGIESQIAFQLQATAARDIHETEKAFRLAEALTGSPVVRDRPRLVAGEAAIARARAFLDGLGWGEGYWIGSIGQHPGSRYHELRNWTLEKWAAAIKHGAAQHGWRLLLTGTPAERVFIQGIFDLLGAASDSVILVEETDGDFDLLFGLMALSGGYFGRDTGPMHLAGALGKPVIAVFGGGTWPRCTPLADRSWAITIGVPCSGCDWNCMASDSHCVKEVPVSEVTRAIDEALRDDSSGTRTRVLDCDLALTTRLAAEISSSAQTEFFARLALMRQMEQVQKG